MTTDGPLRIGDNLSLRMRLVTLSVMVPLLFGTIVLAYFPAQMQASAQQVSEQRVLSLVRVTKAATEPGFEFNDVTYYQDYICL